MSYFRNASDHEIRPLAFVFNGLLVSYVRPKSTELRGQDARVSAWSPAAEALEIARFSNAMSQGPWPPSVAALAPRRHSLGNYRAMSRSGSALKV